MKFNRHTVGSFIFIASVMGLAACRGKSDSAGAPGDNPANLANADIPGDAMSLGETAKERALNQARCV